MGIKLGLNAKLYRNSAASGSPSWNEITNVRDVTLNLETGEADVSTRNNSGWRASIGTLKSASLEFEMVWDTADDDFGAIRDAFLNNSSIEFAVLDGASTAPGTQGLRATMAIINFTRSEPLEEAIKVSVTAKPTYSATPPTWMTVS
ncbi:MAG: phage tail tube protein [Planctomycetaceae bacterium]